MTHTENAIPAPPPAPLPPVWDRFHAAAPSAARQETIIPPLNPYSETLFTLGAQAFLANQPDQAETLLRLALGGCGKDFAALGLLALMAIERKDFAAAEGWLRAALVIEPDEPTTLNNLGEALRQLDRYEEALACYPRAIAQAPDYAEAHDNMGCALVMSGRPEEALPWHRRAIALKRDFALAHERLGVALVSLNRHEEGLRSLREVLALDPEAAKARTNEACALLALGRYTPGWKAYEARLDASLYKQPAVRRHADHPRWTGRGKLAGKRLLLYAEQGLGDTLQFVRYAPLMAERGASILLEVHTPLVKLFQGLGCVDAVVELGAPPPEYDLQCPLMSLPMACRTTLETVPAEVPYLAAPADRLTHWRKYLGQPPRGRNGRKRRVGLVWSGNPDHTHDRLRSMPLARLAPLLARTDLEFHVVQAQVRPADRDVLDAMPEIRDHSRALGDFTDTAALLSLMDLVISVDTSVAHLAGALARPTWLMLAFSAEWRWLVGRTDSPWYPTMRLFRQSQPGVWDDVLAAVMDALDA